MAINYSDFIYSNTEKEGKNLSSGIKSNKEFTKFLFQFRVQGNQFRKTFNYTSLDISKKDRIKKVNFEAERYKKQKTEELDNELTFSLDTKFERVAKEYCENKCSKGTKWTEEKKGLLDHYIYLHLKGMKASTIKERDIDKIRVFMESHGYGKQNENGCSPRTIRKVLLQVLKPILEYGYRNGAMRRIPEIDVPKKTKKKIVKNGSEKLKILFETILVLYKNDSFYRALFLFALFGRRWNEIRTLEWTDIDFESSKYTIRAINSKIDEDKTFALPNPLYVALSEFRDTGGLVFKSFRTGRELSLPKKQIDKLREFSGIPELTMHYFRHVLATALGESGVVNTVLSASLGHNDVTTVDAYYKTTNHLKGSKEAVKAIEHIVEVG